MQKKEEGGKGDMWPLSCMDEGFPMLHGEEEREKRRASVSYICGEICQVHAPAEFP